MRDSDDIFLTVSEPVANAYLAQAGFEIDDDGCWVRPSDPRMRTNDTGRAVRWALEDAREDTVG